VRLGVRCSRHGCVHVYHRAVKSDLETIASLLSLCSVRSSPCQPPGARRPAIEGGRAAFFQPGLVWLVVGGVCDRTEKTWEDGRRRDGVRVDVGVAVLGEVRPAGRLTKCVGLSSIATSMEEM
jgi:hypothetical protein